MRPAIQFLLLVSLLLFITCGQRNTFPCKNVKTEDARNGGFMVLPYNPMETPPEMVLVEGGAFRFQVEGAEPVRTSVNSFFISRYEETNGQYLAYLTFLKKYYSKATYEKALPDTLVWLKENLSDSLKKYLVSNYLRHLAYKDYPVVGVSPEQIKKYAAWKTDRVNEMIMIREGILDFDSTLMDSAALFSTNGYLSGKYDSDTIKKLIPKPAADKRRRVRMEDGIFLPHFRLPVMEEWMVAAMAIGDAENKYVNTSKEPGNRKFDKKNYFGHLYIRDKAVASGGATFILVRMKGPGAVFLAGKNKYYIYGMSGNVSEIVTTGKEFAVLGGSWKSPGPDYSAVYKKNPVDSLNYSVPNKFRILKDKEQQVSSLTGFRLAMTYIGYCPDGSLPFKRSKR